MLRRYLPPWATVRFFLGVLLMVAGLLTAALAGASWTDTPDDQAQWIEAVATVLAFAAAIYAAKFAYGAYKLETDREERLIEDRRRAQAQLVAAWPAVIEPLWGKDEDGLDIKVGVKSVTVLLRNASPVPVTEVVVGLWAPYPDFNRYVTVGYLTKHVLPPGSDNADLVFADIPDSSEIDPDRDFRVRMTFRDAAGYTWERDADGFLRPLDGPPED